MATAATKKIDLEITSDSICPFCFVGYRRIQQAIRIAKERSLPLSFSLRFAPFLLDPTLPPSPGESKRERYVRRFGGEERVRQMEEAMKERGRACDPPIEFSYGGNVSQTTDSHRLIEKARELKGEEGQLALVERLFKTYFEEEGDPASHELLARDAVTTGIFPSADEARAFLASDELKDSVAAGIKKAQLRGITGVPFTIINGQLGVSGAQEVDTFVKVFEQIASGELEA
ncbi:hypothetical protein Rhopal_004720-T1 [Rhodotorula paludigena]|uniref:DSBA-like thioredoxin domain-containing protein n=1 Tax=Rhodotorula paludigena TaxID=86838 RepID=A0AAV5GQD1_9BASI|nr:hypothetical protein Rhopal_004720-T1 [Rhodotorula paludigena]